MPEQTLIFVEFWSDCELLLEWEQPAVWVPRIGETIRFDHEGAKYTATVFHVEHLMLETPEEPYPIVSVRCRT